MIINVKEKDIQIEIPNKLLKSMSSYEQSSNEDEKGGILLGKYDSANHCYCITEFTLPTKNDESGPLYFVRNKEAAQKVINSRWNESKGIINYLGEWHTHPQVRPVPSTVDLKLIRQIIREQSAVWPEVLMLIIGQDRTATLIVAPVIGRGKKQHRIEVNC